MSIQRVAGPLVVFALIAMSAVFGSAFAAPRDAPHDRPRELGATGAQERYHACMADTAVDAERALKTAQDWQKKGGADAADHCVAAAQLALGRYAEAAAELETLAQTGGAGRGPSLRASLFGPSLTIPIENSQPCLGTWQQVILLDFDNRPRTREIIVQLIGESE